ncbi:hypothetical protein [Streptomyces sp. NBC_01443]|uniref:hypothetical protein n=1 Tax=Streptomyces sp. NBC_01443 TaxID=2903868 RepID=UPI00225419FE|nr:hypothetical protein [Streptomyces sp. NBC_01443]MCX4625579.1 hypothetical protein [Streptomyces sp. NBC_01443]
MESITQRLLTRGFGRPSGLLGLLGGRLMAHGNAATELHVVALAAPAEQDVVLVVGPGPGVGLRAAAGWEPPTRMASTAALLTAVRECGARARSWR